MHLTPTIKPVMQRCQKGLPAFFLDDFLLKIKK